MSRPRILALGPQEVAPPVNGGKEGIHGAITALAMLADVTYAYPAGPESALQQQAYREIGVRQVAVGFTPRETPWIVFTSILQGKPYKFEKYGAGSAAREFGSALGGVAFDAIVCFHPHTVTLAERLKRLNGWDAPIILREHNIEFELVESFRDSLSGWKRAAASFFARLTKAEELDIWRRVSAVAFLTDRDLAAARALNPSGDFFLAPEGVPIPPRRADAAASHDAQLLILLNPQATQSVYNLRRFLHEGWRPAKAHGEFAPFSLAVTGVNLDKLSSLTGLEPGELSAMQVRALGFVPSLRDVFASSLALVSPIYVGGGIRKKVLEAMANQVPVIAMPMDIETTGYLRANENILSFETPQDLVKHARALLDDPGLWRVMSDAGRTTVELHARWGLFANAVAAKVETLVGHRAAHEAAQ